MFPSEIPSVSILNDISQLLISKISLAEVLGCELSLFATMNSGGIIKVMPSVMAANQ